MKTFLKTLYALLAAAVLAVACEDPAQEVPVKVHLNKELMSNLPVGSSQTLVATLDPKDAVVTVVWASDNEAVAVVNEEGAVTGVTPGTAVITASVDKEKATCKVIVTAAKATKIEIDPASLRIEKGSTAELKVVATPSDAALTDLVWSSDDKNVATVADGVVTAVAVGKATIMAVCNGGQLAAVCKVVVTSPAAPDNPNPDNPDPDDPNPDNPDPDNPDPDDPNPDNPDPDAPTLEAVTIVAEGDATDLQVGLKLQLTAVFTPSNAKPESISWVISENADAANLSQNGLIEGVYAAKDSDNNWSNVMVTVYADGLEASKQLRVIPRQPDAIEVDMPAEGYIRVGQEWRFNPRVVPEGLGYTVYCSASLPSGKPQNEAYGVFVSDTPGEIKGIFAVSSHNDLVYTSLRKEVYLPVKPYYVETVSLPQTMEVEVGGSFIMNPEFTSDVAGHEPTYKDVKWTSSDETKATVDSYGKVTALAAGTVQITATTSNSYSVPSGQQQKSATCTLTIKDASVSINVGDYYYSDGTWSSQLDPSKTVIGIVFARANSASSDALLAKDYPECVHGLVLSIDEYVMSCTTDRTWLRADLIDWMGQNGYNQWLVDDKYCGYNNTQGLIAINAANVASGSGVIHVDHIDAVLQHREKVQAPAGASAWYMPSYMEMVELSNNLDAVNASLEAAGGTTLRRTYEYIYDRQTGGEPIPTIGTAEQHYYYSNNITENTIYAYNMNTDKLVNPKVSTSPWDSVSGEKTPLPVRVVLAF
ncbi:MAG: Ig-like domain-containing protein [Bacteroidales bacterium]|nr:Ig-like domain-containing protein [Bacteroidales bacterium]